MRFLFILQLELSISFKSYIVSYGPIGPKWREIPCYHFHLHFYYENQEFIILIRSWLEECYKGMTNSNVMGPILLGSAAFHSWICITSPLRESTVLLRRKACYTNKQDRQKMGKSRIIHSRQTDLLGLHEITWSAQACTNSQWQCQLIVFHTVFCNPLCYTVNRFSSCLLTCLSSCDLTFEIRPLLRYEI